MITHKVYCLELVFEIHDVSENDCRVNNGECNIKHAYSRHPHHPIYHYHFEEAFGMLKDKIISSKGKDYMDS
jgi:hypothetical protein